MRSIDEVVRQDSIIASNTSSIPMPSWPARSGAPIA